MAVLFVTDPRFREHDTGPGHPERPARLEAVEAGIRLAGIEEALVRVAPRRATPQELEALHHPGHLQRLEQLVRSGGRYLDGDTTVSGGSYEAAELAAGAGLEAVERLDRGEADAAFCAVRPPGHHATPRQAMGFCLFNNISVTAAHLAARGERVLIVDYDAHHGNGTQDAFYADPRVAFVSLHQYPLYPGTGALEEVGVGGARGLTVNLPLPAGATGAAYHQAIDEVIGPLVARFEPTWLLVSAGFDAHRRDPLTDLGLTAADYADLTHTLLQFMPPGRSVVFLEGGYDLDALSASAGATLSAMAGERFRPEPASAGDIGRTVVPLVVEHHRRLAEVG